MTRARTLDTKDLDSPFVWVYRFDGAGAATAVDTFEPLQPGDPGFVWVHLNISDARARVWTQCQTWMAAEVRDLLTGNNEHQRLAGDDRHICGVFADFARELSGTSEDFGHLRFLVTDQLIVSARRHPRIGTLLHVLARCCLMSEQRLIMSADARPLEITRIAHSRSAFSRAPERPE